MTNLKPEEIINMEGEKGNSLFYRTIAPAVNQEKFTDIQEKLDKYFEKYEKTSDDRALTIICALSVENELDKFLATWIIGYKRIASNKELTFSFKVELASSLKLIPIKILNAIEPIRKIRNIFAHDINIDTFDKAKEFDSKLDKPSFPKLYDKIKTFIVWDKDDDRQTFKTLSIMIILGLNVYTKHTAKVQDYIWNPSNLDKIIKD